MSVYTTSPGRPLREQKLIVSPGDGKLVLYQWTPSKDGWAPEFELMSAEETENSEAPVAISVSGDLLVEFYGNDPDHSNVRRLNLNTMMTDGGPWALSSSAAPLRHGCAFNAGGRAMVLPALASRESSPTVVRLDFSSTHSAFSM